MTMTVDFDNPRPWVPAVVVKPTGEALAAVMERAMAATAGAANGPQDALSRAGALTALPVPPIALQAGVAIGDCGNAAARQYEGLADQVRESADTLIAWLMKLAEFERKSAAHAIAQVQAFGAQTLEISSAVHELREKLAVLDTEARAGLANGQG